jgi:hypothetical protein
VIRKEFEQKNDDRPYREPEYVLWLENELIEARQKKDIAIKILDNCLPDWRDVVREALEEKE